MSSSPILELMNDPQRSTLFKQGAEAKVYISQLFPAPCITTLSEDQTQRTRSTAETCRPTMGLLKYRFPKTYRHQTLSSQLTASRTTAEARSLVRCAKAGVNTPKILCVDDVQGVLGLELIEGNSVRELLGGGSEGDELADDKQKDGGDFKDTEIDTIDDQEALVLMKLIGIQLAKMHQAHVIHGDLTTSNMMVKRGIDRQPKIFLIDFGLSSNSTMAEDKAVDLYVLERAFQSTHPSSEHLFLEILQAYQETLELSTSPSKASIIPKPKGGTKNKIDKGSVPSQTSWKEVYRKLEDVRLRGRKRSMVG